MSAKLMLAVVPLVTAGMGALTLHSRSTAMSLDQVHLTRVDYDMAQQPLPGQAGTNQEAPDAQLAQRFYYYGGRYRYNDFRYGYRYADFPYRDPGGYRYAGYAYHDPDFRYGSYRYVDYSYAAYRYSGYRYVDYRYASYRYAGYRYYYR